MTKNKKFYKLIYFIILILVMNNCGVIQIKSEYKGKFRTSEEIEKLKRVERKEKKENASLAIDNASWAIVDKRNVKSIKTFLTTVRTSKYKNIAINKIQVINAEMEKIAINKLQVINAEREKIAKAKGPHKQETNYVTEQGESVYLFWSRYYGLTNWSDAKQKCEANEMRLPTKDELVDLYRNISDTEPEKAWPNIGCYKNKACNYWSSDNDEEVPSGVMLTVLMSNGTVEGRHDLDNNDVRCIHISEKEREDNVKKLILSSKTLRKYKSFKVNKKYRKKRRKFFKGMGINRYKIEVMIDTEIRVVQRGAYSFQLKVNKFLVLGNNDPEIYKYKIKKNTLYLKKVKNDTYEIFGKFSRRKSLFTSPSGKVYKKY